MMTTPLEFTEGGLAEMLRPALLPGFGVRGVGLEPDRGDSDGPPGTDGTGVAEPVTVVCAPAGPIAPSAGVSAR